jgi:PQQ-dependent catabolism-associated CXXCW motif protein
MVQLRALASAIALLLTTSSVPVLASEAETTQSTDSAAAEPAGYWMGPVNSPVPATLTGGKVIHTDDLQSLLDKQHPVLIDVSNAPRRPEQLAPQAPWLPLDHQSIPGSLWMPGVGLGDIPASAAQSFRERLAAATGGDRSRPIVVYCHEHCWLSWNAAKRAISYGYQNVYWFPDGVEGWRAAGQRTVVVQPSLQTDASPARGP